MTRACRLHLRLFLDGEIPKLKVVFLVVYLDVADPDSIFGVHGAANLVRCRWNRWLPLALHAPIQVIVDEIIELDIAVIANLAEPASFSDHFSDSTSWKLNTWPPWKIMETRLES